MGPLRRPKDSDSRWKLNKKDWPNSKLRPRLKDKEPLKPKLRKRKRKKKLELPRLKDRDLKEKLKRPRLKGKDSLKKPPKLRDLRLNKDQLTQSQNKLRQPPQTPVSK